MATVCMTLHSALDDPKNDTTKGTLNSTLNGSCPLTGQEAEFTWSSEFEGTVLASFNFGFIASPILGGYVAGYFGGKRVIAVALVIGAMSTVLTPVSVRANRLLLVFMRVTAGLVMGAVDPSIQYLWSNWAPVYEKSQLTACSFSGLSIAGITTFLVSGYLCTIQLDNGWPFIFYVFGGFALLLLGPWLYFVYDSPERHPRIKLEEVKYINHGKTTGSSKMNKPPWSKIVKSMPFWAIVVAHINHGWTTTWVLAYLPKYLKNILLFGVREDGILSSVAFAGPLLSSLLCGYSSDWLIRKRFFSTGTVRKMYQGIGCVGCSACFFAISFLDHNSRSLAVGLLIVALFFQQFTTVAFRINHLDIAPRYAGVLMGITITIAMLAALSAPFITSAIITEDTQMEWQHVFWIVAALNIIGGVFYVIFAKGEVQSWANNVIIETIDPPMEEPIVKANGIYEQLELPSYSEVVVESGFDNPNFTKEDEKKTDSFHEESTVYEESSTKL
ncbi:hypothetical protein SNE40_022744 [Patella caerulea]|uniref:Major facilitator superfamily (MFS) profile domain-containing protein n=1 Tax=Patella caerulea TaxID=87958 RepID=A0AAN8G1E5_PATCE